MPKLSGNINPTNMLAYLHMARAYPVLNLRRNAFRILMHGGIASLFAIVPLFAILLFSTLSQPTVFGLQQSTYRQVVIHRIAAPMPERILSDGNRAVRVEFEQIPDRIRQRRCMR